MVPETIKTARLWLRSYTKEDYTSFCRFMLDPEIGRYMDNNPADPEQAGRLFSRVEEIYANPPGGRYFDIWAIKFEGNCIGHLELKESENTEANELEVVYLVEKLYWNRGFISEVMSAIVDHARNEGRVVIATVDPGNKASLRVLEKQGIGKVRAHDGGLKIWLTTEASVPQLSHR